MLRIPAPTAQDRFDQWVDAYDAAEGLFVRVFKNSSELACDLNEVFLELVCDAIAEQYGIPVHIAAAATLTAAQDLHEQYHNPV